MYIAGLADPAPALDARKLSLDARPVAAHPVAIDLFLVDHQVSGRITDPGTLVIASMAFMPGNPGTVRVLPIDRHQIFGTRQEKDVRFRIVLVLRQPLVRLSGDGGEGEEPAEAEGTVSGAGVVAQRQLRAEPGPTGTCGDGHRHRASAGDGVGREFLSHPANRAAAFREIDRRSLDYLRLFSPGIVRRIVIMHPRLPVGCSNTMHMRQLN